MGKKIIDDEYVKYRDIIFKYVMWMFSIGYSFILIIVISQLYLIMNSITNPTKDAKTTVDPNDIFANANNVFTLMWIIVAVFVVVALIALWAVKKNIDLKKAQCRERITKNDLLECDIEIPGKGRYRYFWMFPPDSAKRIVTNAGLHRTITESRFFKIVQRAIATGDMDLLKYNANNPLSEEFLGDFNELVKNTRKSADGIKNNSDENEE